MFNLNLEVQAYLYFVQVIDNLKNIYQHLIL